MGILRNIDLRAEVLVPEDTSPLKAGKRPLAEKT